MRNQVKKKRNKTFWVGKGKREVTYMNRTIESRIITSQYRRSVKKINFLKSKKEKEKRRGGEKESEVAFLSAEFSAPWKLPLHPALLMTGWLLRLPILGFPWGAWVLTTMRNCHHLAFSNLLEASSHLQFVSVSIGLGCTQERPTCPLKQLC